MQTLLAITEACIEPLPRQGVWHSLPGSVPTTPACSRKEDSDGKKSGLSKATQVAHSSIYLEPKSPTLNLLLLTFGHYQWFSNVPVLWNYLGALKTHMPGLHSSLIELQSQGRGWTPEFLKSSPVDFHGQRGLKTIMQNNPVSAFTEGLLLSLSRFAGKVWCCPPPWGGGFADGWPLRMFASSVGLTNQIIENSQCLTWEGWGRPGSVYDTPGPSAGDGTLNSCGRSAFPQRTGSAPRAREFKWTLSPSPPNPQCAKSFQMPLSSSSNVGLLAIINNYILLCGLWFQIVVIQENPIMTVALRSFFQAKQNICLDIFLIGKCFLCWVLGKLNFSLDRGGSCHSITHLWKLHPSLSPGALQIFPRWLGCSPALTTSAHMYTQHSLSEKHGLSQCWSLE